LNIEAELKKSKYELVLNFLKIKDNRQFLKEKLNKWLDKVKDVDNVFIKNILYNYEKNILINLIKE
jgi:hypothetical protein